MAAPGHQRCALPRGRLGDSEGEAACGGTRGGQWGSSIHLFGSMLIKPVSQIAAVSLVSLHTQAHRCKARAIMNEWREYNDFRALASWIWRGLWMDHRKDYKWKTKVGVNTHRRSSASPRMFPFIFSRFTVGRSLVLKYLSCRRKTKWLRFVFYFKSKNWCGEVKQNLKKNSIKRSMQGLLGTWQLM